MEQHIQCASDSPLLQRVSKIREHMGLEVLPTEILESELDPLLQYLLRKESNDALTLDVTAISQEQPQYRWQFDEKFSQWDDWSRWAKNGN